ncbi:phospho-sugar mutase [Peptacetobacter hominis]|uniref:Phosphoglucomutase n=1 Tax=Peptacetobacter hominis TaxID=2743610 RepID=A0A544QYW4_9FIRM|nr:phospho-sugar mutase [Peptacetobacter hominis]TQQ85860.1 phospho-sugar mutase [Peptacetobacter hominis]
MNYIDRYKEWMENPYFDDSVKKELKSIENNEKEIEDRFYKELEFGTAGLRGIIEYGTNRINKYTVRKTTYGLARYLIKNNIEDMEKGVVIAHDNRYKSDEFCREAAETLAASGIKVYIFDSLRTTPELSFLVRYLKCAAGIVITASHNPPEYNGYKVYGPDGAQIMPEIANKIVDEIENIDDYSKIPVIDEKSRKSIEYIGEKEDKAFIEAVKKQISRPEIIETYGKNMKIVYTPLCGTGNIPVRRALSEVGFKNVITVPEEENPDSEFSGIEYPNPEDPKALKRAVKLAEEKGADLVIATDPDCDRVGTAVRTSNGEYVLLTGNQIGGLLVDYIISSRKEKGVLPENAVMVKSIVTSEFGAVIASENNVEVENVLTGFKFIGEKMRGYEKEGNKEFIFGYEESYGYLAGTHARDKDAVVTSLLIAEMAAYHVSKGKTLYEALNDLYEKYGYYREKTVSVTLKGIDGVEKIKNIMTSFRNNHPDEISGKSVSEIQDFKLGVEGYPTADVIKYILSDGSWIAIRPSGTEPKIKFYIAMSGKSDEKAIDSLKSAESYINERIKDLI